jgi:uncharacterized membrane-anchored protein
LSRRGPSPNWYLLPFVVLAGLAVWSEQGLLVVLVAVAGGLGVSAFIWYRYRYRLTPQQQDTYDESARNPTVPNWLFVGAVLVLAAFVVWLIVTVAAGGSGS